MAQVKLLKLNGGDLQQHDPTADELTAQSLKSNTTVEVSTVKLKDNSGELQVRNAADNNYADLRVKNLVVEGTTTTIESTTVTIADNVIVLNKNVTGAPSTNAGIEVERGDETNASILWDETADLWKVGIAGSEVAISLAGHTHDDHYFTETELGSATGTTGSDLIGDDDNYDNFTPSAATLKGALEGIDDALLNAGVDLTKTEYTAGAGGIAQFDAVYISANDTVLKADADAIATARVIGFAIAAISESAAGYIRTHSLITGIGTAWTAGAPVYLSTTAGGLTQTAPTGSGDVVIEVGIAKNATDLQINIQKPVILA